MNVVKNNYYDETDLYQELKPLENYSVVKENVTQSLSRFSNC